MGARLEHANLIVRDIDATLRFLAAAFPDWRLRHDGVNAKGERWVHYGLDDTYIALTEASLEPAEQWLPYSGKPGVNHLGFVVDDAPALSARMTAAGYTDSTPANHHPHRTRVYFYDPDGNDWEFVEYHGADPAERHDYQLPDD